MTIRGGTGSIVGNNYYYSNSDHLTVVNRGTISAEQGNIGVGYGSRATFVNQGTLQVKTGASLSIQGLSGKLGHVSLPASTPGGVVLSIDGTSYSIDQPL